MERKKEKWKSIELDLLCNAIPSTVPQQFPWKTDRTAFLSNKLQSFSADTVLRSSICTQHVYIHCDTLSSREDVPNTAMEFNKLMNTVSQDGERFITKMKLKKQELQPYQNLKFVFFQSEFAQQDIGARTCSHEVICIGGLNALKAINATF